MKLKTIETIIDSVDVYNIAKSIGLNILEKNINKKHTYISASLYNEEIRIFNNAFLNLDIYKQYIPSFAAGSGIDLLAAFYHGDYDKAFDAFFKIYGTALKSKLIHDPLFIKGIIKNSYIKRHNVLNKTLEYLFKPTFTEHMQCKTWLNKHNIEEEAAKGFMFALSTEQLHSYLVFLLNQEFINHDQLKTVDLAKDYPLSKIVDLDLKSYAHSWIIIPYFSNYYSLSFLKIINPQTNEVSYIYFNDIKISYAGLFALNKFINFDEKIRLLEDSSEAAVLISNAKKLLNTQFQYLAVGTNCNGIEAPNLTINKPIFLYKPNSDFNLIKSLNITLPNFYICDFQDFTESKVVYKWEDFIFKQLKQFVKEDAYLSPRIKAFLDIIDVSSLEIKRYIANWLKEKGYNDIYSAFNSISTQVMHFKNYSISSTPNGYLVLSKNDNETTVISNFIIKLDNCIIFKGKDDMKINGVVIMNDQEFPLTFYKKELAKKDALENIALKAFANFNILDGIFNANNSQVIATNLPVIIDKSYNSALSMLVSNELSKIPCLYGQEFKGWDKANKLFTSPAWVATNAGLKIQKQDFYTNTSADYVYKQVLPKLSDYKYSNLNFLNKEIKDCISVLLSYLYRTYFSYEVKPFLVTDTKFSRNLLRFIFAALGQREVFEYDVNERLIKNKKVFVNLNQFPILVRSNNHNQLLKIQHYPYVLFTPLTENEYELYDVSFDLHAENYPKVTKFTLDTLERFFKWLFSCKVESFEIEKPLIENQTQLIEEGNQIFDMLWQKDILEACKKSVDYQDAFKKFLCMFTSDQIKKHLQYMPETNKYIISRIWLNSLTPEKRKIYRIALEAGKKEGVMTINPEQPYSLNYTVISKELIEKVIPAISFADNKQISLNELTIHLSPKTLSENYSTKTSTNSIMPFTRIKLIN